MKKPVIKIGLLGLGTVGSGVYQILSKNKTLITSRIHVQVEIKKILVKNINKKRSIKKILLTKRFDEILHDPEIFIVVEVIGGVQPAKKYITDAIKMGKHVVTANKELIAKHGPELFALAKNHHVNLFFEASVAGGIPIIRNIEKSLAANRIYEIFGIINGTTNYILSKMEQEGWSFEDALKKAQALGYAEADPTADVEGHDAAYKLAILAMLAFNAPIDLKQIKLQGITQITKSDFDFAKEFGFTIKLFGVAKEHAEGIELGVYPCLVPLRHPLANVSGANNAVYVKGDAVGETMFYGPGAGALPTGSSIVGDILQLIPNIHRGATTANLSKSLKPKKFLSPQLAKSGYFLRLTVVDTPGVLAKISSLFAKNKVSIQNTYQKTPQGKVAELVMILHPTQMRYFDNAISQIKKLTVVKKINAILRIVNFGV
jgi:homoserine dehydrogenase